MLVHHESARRMYRSQTAVPTYPYDALSHTLISSGLPGLDVCCGQRTGGSCSCASGGRCRCELSTQGGIGWVIMMTMMMIFARHCLLSSPALFQQDGATPLMVAAVKGHAPVVEMLLAAGANKDLQTKVHGAARTQALPLRDLRMTNLVKPCPHPSLSPPPTHSTETQPLIGPK